MNNKIKGQTTMIMIVLIIIIFLGMSTFLLSLAETVSQSEYLNMYTHNLLSSTLKADTGYLEANCRTVSDLLACSFFSPTYVCGGVQDCHSLAEEKVEDSISRFQLIKEGFRHLIVVEPEGFTAVVGGGIQKVEIGDSHLDDEKVDKITADERISGIFNGEAYILNIRLIVAKKE